MVLVEAQANGLPIIASTAISDEVKINSNFDFLELDLGVEAWADNIENMPKKRVVPDKRIEKFSVRKIALIMEEAFAGGRIGRVEK